MKLKKVLCMMCFLATIASSGLVISASTYSNSSSIDSESVVSGDCSTGDYTPTEEEKALDQQKLEKAMDSDYFNDDMQENSGMKMTRSISSLNKKLNVSVCVQNNGYYCGPATCQQILKYLGVSKTQDQLAETLGTTSDGTIAYYIDDCLNTYQSDNLYVYKEIDADSSQLYGYDYSTWKLRMRTDVYNDYPVAIDIKVTSGTKSTYNWNYTTNGHYLCVSGYDNQSSSTTPYVWVTDPHTTYHGTYKYPAKDVFGVNMTHSRHAIIW